MKALFFDLEININRRSLRLIKKDEFPLFFVRMPYRDNKMSTRFFMQWSNMSFIYLHRLFKISLFRLCVKEAVFFTFLSFYILAAANFSPDFRFEESLLSYICLT